jgi:hypothetical protein
MVVSADYSPYVYVWMVVVTMHIVYPSDPHPSPDYRVIRTPDDLADYIPMDYYGGGMPLLLAQDTESVPNVIAAFDVLGHYTTVIQGHAPYCLTFSVSPGTARLIYARDLPLLQRYRNVLRAFNPYQIFHNYLHDINPFTALHLPVPHSRLRDTMVMAYNYCLGGGGDDDTTGTATESRAGRGSLSLKSLAYRYCHMEMTSFQDTVFPHSLPILLDYLHTASALFQPSDIPTHCICGHPPASHSPRGKTQRRTGPCHTRSCRCLKFQKVPPPPKSPSDKPISLLHRKLSKLISDIESNQLAIDGTLDGAFITDEDDPADNPADNDLNPWTRIKKWHPHDHNFLISALGVWPTPSIAHVPEPALLHYACRDADATGRFYRYLLTLHGHNRLWLFYSH